MTNPTSQTKFRLGVILGVSALALTLGLAACGQQGGGTSSTAPASTESTAPATTPSDSATAPATAPAETGTPPASGGAMDSGSGSATPPAESTPPAATPPASTPPASGGQ